MCPILNFCLESPQILVFTWTIYQCYSQAYQLSCSNRWCMQRIISLGRPGAKVFFVVKAPPSSTNFSPPLLCTSNRLYVAPLFNIDLTGTLMDDGGGGSTSSLNLSVLQTKFKIGHTVISNRYNFSNVAREPMVQWTSNFQGCFLTPSSTSYINFVLPVLSQGKLLRGRKDFLNSPRRRFWSSIYPQHTLKISSQSDKNYSL